MLKLKNWGDNHVFNEVKDVGQPRISCTWALAVIDDGTKKARLEARGFEDYELSKPEKESLTTTRETVRIMLFIASVRKWELKSIDIKSAFLQGEEATRTVFLFPQKSLVRRVFGDLTRLYPEVV